jgi:hypothetical protein
MRVCTGLQNVWVVQKLDAAAVQRYASSVLAPEAELLASAEPVSVFEHQYWP